MVVISPTCGHPLDRLATSFRIRERHNPSGNAVHAEKSIQSGLNSELPAQKRALSKAFDRDHEKEIRVDAPRVFGYDHKETKLTLNILPKAFDRDLVEGKLTKMSGTRF